MTDLLPAPIMSPISSPILQIVVSPVQPGGQSSGGGGGGGGANAQLVFNKTGKTGFMFFLMGYP